MIVEFFDVFADFSEGFFYLFGAFVVAVLDFFDVGVAFVKQTLVDAEDLHEVDRGEDKQMFVFIVVGSCYLLRYLVDFNKCFEHT